MKIQKLLMDIHEKNFNLETELQVKKYLPLEVKKTIAQGIIYECTENENGAIKIDSVQRYLSYVKYMVTMHTNLEYTDDDYDTLCSVEYGNTTLMDAIMKCFEHDANECQKVLNWMINDYLRENGVEYMVAQLIGNLNATLGDFSYKIMQKIDGINLNDMLPDDVDKKQFSAFLNKYIK